MSRVLSVTPTDVTKHKVDLSYPSNGFFDYEMSCSHHRVGKDYRRWRKGELVQPKTLSCAQCNLTELVHVVI